MKIERLLVTGEEIYLRRLRPLYSEISTHIEYVDYLPREALWYEKKPISSILKLSHALRSGSISKAGSLFQKKKAAFVAKSKDTERRIKALGYTPDLVFHNLCVYRPFYNSLNIPYVLYLDYSIALSEKAWQPWAYFANRQQRDDWFACEQQTYAAAKHIFTMSNVLKQSLINDFGIPGEKITVVGASGGFLLPYAGEKSLGSQRLLCNGSDFERKGGDLVLSAFKLVKAALPNASLTIIGKEKDTDIEGVDYPGNISPSQLHDLILTTDLVIAPARCEPFGFFHVDAMNCGVPCVVMVNPCNGMPEFLEHQQDSILIDEVEMSPERLAKEIIHVLSNPELLKSMSDAARHKVQTQLNWSDIAKHIVYTLNSI